MATGPAEFCFLALLIVMPTFEYVISIEVSSGVLDIYVGVKFLDPPLAK
jgi:hypothetical protein